MNTNLIPNFVGKRWLKIALRTLHLIGFAGVFTAVITGSSQPSYWVILFVSGFGLLALESLSNLVWFVQVRGLVMYIKFTLLVLLFIYPQYAWHCIIAMIILSGIISHAPSSVRYFSFIHFRKITSLNDTKG